MPSCYLLENIDIAINALPLVVGVIMDLLFNIQRFLRVLLVSPPAFVLRFPNLCILRVSGATSGQR